jgi:dienelactone hydrolase
MLIQRFSVIAAVWSCLTVTQATVGRVQADPPNVLPGTAPLTAEGDLAAAMRAGIDRYVTRATEESIARRARHWQRDVTSREAYEASVAPNRQRFRRIIGLVEERVPATDMELVATTTLPALLAETDRWRAYAVRWPVFAGVWGEGVLLTPRDRPLARVVCLPDADQTPEQLVGLADGLPPEGQFARHLADAGCQVIVPVLIDRQSTWSGNPAIAMTNQTHREWVYRSAFDFGRHVIGYEVAKVLAAVDWFAKEAAGSDDAGQPAPIAVAGYAEGGLLAFYAAAADTRIDAALVSGYFDDRQRLWDEPIYRNVFGLLDEFGDAEIASLIAPRALILEHAPVPSIDALPPTAGPFIACAAPGVLRTPDFDAVQAEFDRAASLCPAEPGFDPPRSLISGDDGAPLGPGSPAALSALLNALNIDATSLSSPAPHSPLRAPRLPDPATRQQRQINQLIAHNQSLIVTSERERAAFWQPVQPTTPDAWQADCQRYKDYLWDEIIGRFPPASLPINARTRRIYDEPTWIGYEVMLDVWPDVFCWGILLVPKDIAPGERRPVVVCQHGLEGQPADVITRDENDPAWNSYKGFAARLAERGFVTYAPHNFYRGGNEFRQLQRKLYPLKKTMYSVILAQHDRHLDWLGGLPFVDPTRIGYYGLSYGGFTAVRVPPLLDRYCLSISSAEFNDMVRKKASVDHKYSYPFYNTYEVFEFDLSSKFGYGDLAGLMVPRPFMVERGHTDGVAPDEWVAAEYAKVRRLYGFLGIPGRTRIEFFNGPHTINGVGTFEFLHEHLNWPVAKAAASAEAEPPSR